MMPSIWRNVIVFASFCVLMLQMGSLLTLGVYLVPLKDEFDTGAALAGWIASSSIAVLGLSGLASSIVVKRVGCRTTAIIGGILISTGLIASAFASSILYLFITLSLITGFGAGLTHVSATVIIGDYFTTSYTTANGLAYVGPGVGVFAFPPLIQQLIATYGWRGSVFIQGAIAFNIVAAACLFRPRRKLDMQKSSARRGVAKTLDIRTVDDGRQQGSTNKEINDIECISMRVSTQPYVLVNADSDSDRKEEPASADDRTNVKSKPAMAEDNTNLKEELATADDTTYLQREPTTTADTSTLQKEPTKGAERTNLQKEPMTTDDRSNLQKEPMTTDDRSNLKRKPTDDLTYLQKESNTTNDRSNVKKDPTTAGDGANLQKEPTTTDDMTYLQNESIVTDDSTLCGRCRTICTKYIPTLSVTCMCFLMFFISVGYISVIVHGVARASETGVSDSEASLVISVMGASSIFSRLTHGVCIDRGWISALGIEIASLALSTAATYVTLIVEGFEVLIVFAICIGVASGVYFTLIPVIVRQIDDKSRFPYNLGLVLAFAAIGDICGGYFTGYIRDTTGSYNAAYYFAGGAFILATIVALIIYVYTHQKRRRGLLRRASYVFGYAKLWTADAALP